MTTESNNQPLTNVDTNLGGLSSISENSHPSLLREQSASPEPIEEGRNVYFDLEHLRRRQDSKESPSNSPTTTGPLDERESSSLNKANRSKTQRSSGVPPSAIRNKHAEAHVSSQSQRRQSTTTTQNTQSSGNSEPFEDSEVWDQKAILSLGKSRSHRYVRRNPMILCDLSIFRSSAFSLNASTRDNYGTPSFPFCRI